MGVLITGVSGFFGGYLVGALQRRPAGSVFGIDLEASPATMDWVRRGVLQFETMDLCSDHLKRFLQKNPVDCIYHLAGGRGSNGALSAYEQNILATARLFEAVRGTKVKVIVIGSSAEYGNVGSDRHAITEDDPLLPVTPYGVAKASVDLMAYQFSLENASPVIRVRPFNVIGPGQNVAFFCAKIAHYYASAKPGNRIVVGNLDTYRDFVDVRDVVRALVLLEEKGRSPEAYNICSGRSVSMSWVAQYYQGKTKLNLELEGASPTGSSSSLDVHYQMGSYQKLFNDTGWKPEFSLEESLDAILEDVRKKL